jgi:hypothetical protein
MCFAESFYLKEKETTMNKKQVALTIGLAVFSSFIGGVLSSQLLLAQPALAAAREFTPRVIVGREFRLLDQRHRTRALLQLDKEDSEVGFTLFAQDGRPRIKLLVDREGNPSAHFWDKQARGRTNPINRPSVVFYDGKNNIYERVPSR